MSLIVVTGANGLLGRDIVEVLGDAYTTVPLVRWQLDVTIRTQVMERLMDMRPAVILNCAAYSNVDGCEENQKIARSVNALGAKFLAEAALQIRSYLVHLSTDYVFDGSKPHSLAYCEEDRPLPLSIYGQTKLEGEVFVRSITPDHLIVRTAWLYGRHGPSFPRSVLLQAIRGQTLRVVNDQFGAPTWSRSLALQIRALIESHVRGTVHATSHGSCTWFDFAKQFLDYMDIESTLTPCKTSEYPRPAPRPLNSILKHRRLQNLGLDRMPHWKEDLERFVKGHGQDFRREIIIS